MAVVKKAAVKKPVPGTRTFKRKAGTAGKGHQLTKSPIVAEQAIDCYDLKLKGLSNRAIGAQLGISEGTVRRRVAKRLEERVAPKVEEYRTIMFDRCERLLNKLDDAIECGDEKAVGAYVRVMERQAKLLGLDAALQVEATVADVEADPEVVDRITQARNKSTATRAAMIAAAEVNAAASGQDEE